MDLKLYFIRHGETDWNKNKRLQGHADIPLNETGRSLARKTAEALQNIPFDLIIASPLDRAVETGKLVTGSREIPMITDERIKELGFGEVEGCYHQKEEAKQLLDIGNFHFHPDKYAAPAGGETFHEVKKRTDAFMEELLSNKEYEDKTILIATHGAAVCSLLNYVDHTPVENFWRSGVHKNCAVSIVECNGGRAEIVQENQILSKLEE